MIQEENIKMNKLIIDKENVIDITDNIVELEIKVNKLEINDIVMAEGLIGVVYKDKIQIINL